MVSYCPFMGNCCFLPTLNLLSLGIGGACDDNCTTILKRTKNIWEDKIQITVDCDINPSQRPLAHVQVHQVKI
jgi:hypothetical protein